MGSEGNPISTVCEGGFKWVIRIHCHTAWHGIMDVFGGRWAKLELASYIPPALPDTLSSVLGSCLLYGIGEDLLLGCRDIFLPQWSDHTYGTRLCAPCMTGAAYIYVYRALCIWEGVASGFWC